MKALIADQKLVTELLPMDEAIEVMRQALTMLAEGDVVMPLRQMLVLPGGDSVMGLMPSYLGGLEAVGVKVVAAFPANFGTEYDTHQGVVLFFDTEQRPAARHRRRHLHHRHPHRRRERAGHRPAGAPRRRRPGDHRRRHAGAHAPAGDDGRAARPARARVQRAGRERRGVRGARVAAARASTVEVAADGRGGRRGRRPHLHDDHGHRAGRAAAPGSAPARTSTPSAPTRRRRGSSTPRSSPAPRLYADRRESLLSEAGRVPHPQGRGADRRRAHRRRDRRGAHGQGAGAHLARRDHPVQVARHRHRGPRRGAPRVRRRPRSASSAPGSRSAAGTSAAPRRAER